jgi:hypothetical protein
MPLTNMTWVTVTSFRGSPFIFHSNMSLTPSNHCFYLLTFLFFYCFSHNLHNYHESSDVDECLLDQTECDKNARCINTPGSYSCECLPGYRGDGLNCQRKYSCKQRESLWTSPLESLTLLLCLAVISVVLFSLFVMTTKRSSNVLMIFYLLCFFSCLLFEQPCVEMVVKMEENAFDLKAVNAERVSQGNTVK